MEFYQPLDAASLNRQSSYPFPGEIFPTFGDLLSDCPESWEPIVAMPVNDQSIATPYTGVNCMHVPSTPNVPASTGTIIAEEPKSRFSASVDVTSNGELNFTMKDKRVISVPEKILDAKQTKLKAFNDYFANYKPCPEDIQNMKTFRRRYQLRKSSERGRRLQRERQAVLERHLGDVRIQSEAILKKCLANAGLDTHPLCQSLQADFRTRMGQLLDFYQEAQYDQEESDE